MRNVVTLGFPSPVANTGVVINPGEEYRILVVPFEVDRPVYVDSLRADVDSSAGQVQAAFALYKQEQTTATDGLKQALRFRFIESFRGRQGTVDGGSIAFLERLPRITTLLPGAYGLAFHVDNAAARFTRTVPHAYSHRPALLCSHREVSRMGDFPRDLIAAGLVGSAREAPYAVLRSPYGPRVHPMQEDLQ